LDPQHVHDNPHSCVYDPKAQGLWVTNEFDDSVERLPLNPPGDSAKYDLAGKSRPWAITYDPVNSQVWVSGSGASTAERFPPRLTLSSTLFGLVGLGLESPRGVVYGSVKGVASIWMINHYSGALSRIGAKHRTSRTSDPACTLKEDSIACLAQMGDFDPVHQTVWVANTGAGSISIFH